MVIREIKGLENGYFENIEGTSEWYYSHVSSKSFCDLYEAEEIVNDGYTFVGMSLENGYFENIEGTSEWYYSHVSSKSFCDLYEAEEIVNDGYTFVGMSCALIHYPDGKVFKPFEIRENIYVEKPVFLDGKIYFLEVDFDKKIMRLIYIDSEELLRENFKDYNENDNDKSFNISIEDIKHIETEISLSEVEDCYNLMLKIAPVMITRCGNEGCFEIIYPEKKKYNIEAREGISLSEVEDCYNLMLKIAPVMITRCGNEGCFEIIYPEKKKYNIEAREGFDFRNRDDMYFASWDENPEYEDFVVVRNYESGIYPEKKKYNIEAREGFDFRNRDDMYFASWDENPEYEDFVVVRNYESGEVKRVEKGSIFRMPNGEMWKI